MQKFITNKMKNELSFCLFNLIVMIFFPGGRPVSGIVRNFKCPVKKLGSSVQALAI